MAEWTLRCADCGWEQRETEYFIRCPACDGFLEVKFASVPEKLVDPNFKSIFKFHPLMPYDPIGEDLSVYETTEDTPIVLAPRLSEKLGVELWFKDETAMASGTWKDREGFISIYRLMKNKVPDLFVFSSGNTGTSLARSASIVKGPRLYLVIPKESEERLGTYREFFDPEYVKVVFFNGSNDECITEAKRLSAEMKIPAESGFSNYARREGLKLCGLELALSWGKKFDWYVQAVAGGIGVYSLHKAYRDMGRREDCPHILGVQAAICAPLVNAWRAGAETLEERYVPQEVIPSPYVRVLRTRRPDDSYPILKKIMDEVGGRFEDAADPEILEGLRDLYLDDYYKIVYRETGKLCGLEPATAIAGVTKSVRNGAIAKGARVVLNVSGAAKIGDVPLNWLDGLL